MWLGDYSYSNLYDKQLPISGLYTTQYILALDHVIREVLIVDPDSVPIYVLKADISIRFYCIRLVPPEVPKTE